MDYTELKNLILFPLGTPSVYYITLGMYSGEIETYLEQIENKETENYNINDLLKKYDIAVDTGYNDDMKVVDISVFIPINELSERDIRLLFKHYSYEVDTYEKRFSITTDADDSITDLDAVIHSDLLDIFFRLDEEKKNVIIMFFSDDYDKVDKLRCLSILSRKDKDFVDDLRTYIEKHEDYWPE